jgi:hypothetical protein
MLAGSGAHRANIDTWVEARSEGSASTKDHVCKRLRMIFLHRKEKKSLALVTIDNKREIFEPGTINKC